MSSLFEYCEERAYPLESRALILGLHIPPPPVDIVAQSFRETRGGKDSAQDGTKGPNPLWGAIQSTLAAVDADNVRARELAFDYAHSQHFRFQRIDEAIDQGGLP